MEEMLIALGLAIVVGVPVTMIVLLVWVTRLSRRVASMERAIVRAAKTVVTPPTPAGDDVEVSPVPTETLPQPARADSPWEAAKGSAPVPEPPVAPAAPAASGPPKAVVLRAEKARALGAWLRDNWFYAVSAVSLALAGVFLLQYGIEAGLLPPVARVLAALAFGAALVAAGEYLRRRWGDGEDAATAHLPSTFSSAGIVTLFAAILAARHMYDLIGVLPALGGLVLVAGLAVVLGWFSGPLLAAVGITGAMAAPFVVGGESDFPEIFYAYFALVALVGLLVDAVRRWAWVSLLTLVLAYGAGWMLYFGSGGPEWAMALVALLVPAAIAVPPLSLRPGHDGAAIVQAFQGPGAMDWPDYPTRLAAGAMVASVLTLVGLSMDGQAEFWLALALLALLALAIAVWARSAPALEDLALPPAAALVALPLIQADRYLPVYAGFRAALAAEPGSPMAAEPFYLAALAAFLGLVAAWRSLAGARWPVIWAAGAVLLAPAMAIGVEVFWRPAEVVGAYPWALTAAALAALMGLKAGWFARADDGSRMRPALATLSALGLIAFALILVLSETALTLALAVVVLAAAALDRRFDLKPMTWFVQLGVVVLGWRLIVDPGVPWAIDAPLTELLAAHAGTIAILIAALALLRSRDRVAAIVMVESAIWSLAAILISLLLFRWLDSIGSGRFDTHWGMGLTALVWWISAANQVWRARIEGPLRQVRLALGSLFAVIGGGAMALALSLYNPLLTRSELVQGPPVFDTLLVAYGLAALLLAAIAWRFGTLPHRLRIGLAALAAVLGTVWIGLEIRHVWRGPVLAVPGTTQPELYSYTVAMLLAGAGFLYQAIANGSTLLRRIAMGVIALTVAKVFLIDISGLSGLTRVFSLLALGLSLAGLAWLNRWAVSRVREDLADPAEEGPGDG